MDKTWVIIVCFVLQLYLTDAARILALYPVASISHQVVFRPLTLELIKRGHEVVVMTPDPMFPKGQAPQNLTEIDVHDISYKVFTGFLDTAKGSKENLMTQIKLMIQLNHVIVDKQLQVKEIQEISKGKEKFDLVMSEAAIKLMLPFTHIYKVPHIQVSSFGALSENYDIFGAPNHPLLYPQPVVQRIYNLTMIEKLYELYNTFTINKLINEQDEFDIQMLRKHFGSDLPSFNDLKNNVDMLFLNINPIWEGSRPVPPSVIHMGGLHQKPEKELPADLKSYLDSSKNGVIYISFGTNVQPSMLPPEKIQTLVKVVSKLPYDVLWKWDKDELPGRSANIKISKWLPQSDLLRHAKVKVFITQGGLQSTDEAITAGVPLIGIPMLGDQWYNVEKYVYHGIGVQLDLETLTEETFSNAIKTVIGDESYRKNIIRLRTLMNDQPQRPLERAIWWIEYVLRHGGAKHLRSPAANISWAQYLELELVAVVLLVLLFFIIIIFGIVFALYKFVSKIFIVKAKTKTS